MPPMNEVDRFIGDIADHRRADEARRLDGIFGEVTGWRPRLWSGRMIGYGSYDYTYASGHSGTSLATGFAQGARQISLYIMPGYEAFPEIMSRLGRHRTGKACVYFARLDDADETALVDLIRAGLDRLVGRWPVSPS